MRLKDSSNGEQGDELISRCQTHSGAISEIGPCFGPYSGQVGDGNDERNVGKQIGSSNHNRLE